MNKLLATAVVLIALLTTTQQVQAQSTITLDAQGREILSTTRNPDRSTVTRDAQGREVFQTSKNQDGSTVTRDAMGRELGYTRPPSRR
jgi:YD repeat-containing protein